MSEKKRSGCWTGLVVVLVVAAVLAGLGIWLLHKLGGISLFNTSQCVATAESQSYTYDLEQMQNASTIAAVGIKLGVPSFGIEIAEATARQESKFYNVTGGDRDSLGLFQQRPSEGWGTASEIMDTTYSSTAFYNALLKVSNWQNLSLTVAAQDVQHSAYPDAYATREQEGVVLMKVFTGTAGGALTCTLNGPTFSPQATDGSGLTTLGQSVVTDAEKQWGTASVEDVSGSARAFSLAVPNSLSGTAATERGWGYANWAVSKAEVLGITQVGYDGKTWSASNNSNSWQTASPADAPTGRVILTMTQGS
ncbi:hypothetical protein [Actinospica sp.]|uniref:hypothetical protein n=1 Tax=Actinospica sp. TaxID=1872142 RepID=UPI002CD19061|nr:hypothetical protein [Actinospica sp.]HWG23118.1 hypothetical protein [Actinospica sp.]